MLVPALLLALLVAAPVVGQGTPGAAPSVPDEPGAIVLPEAAILQAVAADLDQDGRRELVRLVRAANDAALAEVWAQDAEGWRMVGERVEVVPASRSGFRIDPVYSATPVRLLVRHVDGIEHVTVASQPHFEEIDVGPPCCLLLHDLVVEGGVARRRAVAVPSDFADGVLVIDLDGDGTDELLVTHSLPPAADISFPTEARVHRWVDGAFTAPSHTRLEIGSGDSPFLLGDSDGVAGDEAAIVSTLGRPSLYRIRMVADDRLAVDDAGLVADQAMAVPIGDRRGVAVTGPVVGLMVAEWPAGEPVATPISESLLDDARLVGTVVVEDQPRLVVHHPSTDAVQLLSLPTLLATRGFTITRSPAAATISTTSFDPYRGPLPGGGVDGTAAIVHNGRLIPSLADRESSGTALMATLAGAAPIGLVGARDQVAIQHAPVGPPAPGPGGGSLTAPGPVPLGWTSIAPLELVRLPEDDEGNVEPALHGAVRVDAPGGIAVGPAGFTAEVTAPPGSRIIATDLDSSLVSTPIVVPDDGRVDVPYTPPDVLSLNAVYRPSLVVTTPAGHAYAASWEVQMLTEPPSVEANTSTSFGSTSVEIAGVAARHATVRVDGRAVEVSADGRFATTVELPPWPTDVLVEVDDLLGNVTSTSVSGIGLFDYRGLPWALIVASLVALATLVLFLRSPRPSRLPRRADDDAALEELEPD